MRQKASNSSPVSRSPCTPSLHRAARTYHVSPPSEEINQERLNQLRGVANVKRVDESLYGDYETEDARKVGGSGLTHCAT